MRCRLSVLDLSPIPSGASAGEALRNTIDLARHAEALGLSRYWLAEHHNAGSLASSAPEVMIGQVAAATSTLRVGAGGIMLPNHSPLKVAEVFRVLHALYPGRVDLGLGRAAGTDPRTARALRRTKGAASADDFPEQLAELCAYFDADAAPRAPFAGTIAAIPVGVPTPDLWLLGSSEFGGALAARLGLGFAYAHHLNPDDAVAVLRRYRADFQPSRYRTRPESILAAAASCAESDREAEVLASSAQLGWLRFTQGIRDLPMPSVAEAQAHRYDDEERALLAAHHGRQIVGAPARVRDALLALADSGQADEIMVTTHVHDHAARRRSYTLLAQALAA